MWFEVCLIIMLVGVWGEMGGKSYGLRFGEE